MSSHRPQPTPLLPHPPGQTGLFATTGFSFQKFEDLYGTTPAAITAAAADPRHHAGQLHQLGRDLDSDGSVVAQSVQGDIAALGTATTPASSASHHLGRTGLVVAGCLELVGAVGAAYDATVDRLVSEYNAEKLNACDPSAPPSAHLKHEYHHARGTLRAGLENSVHLLRNRHRLSTVRTLMDAGFIPLSALQQWPGLKKLIVKEINSGHILDPGIALGLPPSTYSPAGQAALVDWIRSHQTAIAQLLAGGMTLNLPEPADGAGYSLRLPIIDSESLKVEYLLTIGGGAAALKFTGGKDPGLGGTISDGNGNLVELDKDGWSIRGAIAKADGTNANIEWDKDGPWLSVSHETELSEDGTAEVTVKVRPPVGSDDPGDPDAPAEPSPFRQFVHNLEHEPAALAGAVKHAATWEGHKLKDGADAWGKWIEDQVKGIGPALRDPDGGPSLPAIPGIPDVPVPVPVVP